MGENTDIEWTDHTWGPWEGCTKVSAGCAHCYAATRNHRFGNDNWGPGKPRRLTVDWKKPVNWNREFEKNFGLELGAQRPRVFPSLCDWLDDEVPIEWLEKFIELIHKTENLNWLLLTKRPENFVPRLRDVQRHCTVDPLDIVDRIDAWISGERFYQNVLVGTSVEDQANADRRIPELLKIPARLRFLSVEPMLGPVDLTKINEHYGDAIDCLRGYAFHDVIDHVKQPGKIDWVIVGGESGPGARPCKVAWIRDIVRQCAAANVPCLVKQLGAHAEHQVRFNEIGDTEDEQMRLKHPKGGDPSEWPEDLRVRQFPEVHP